MCAANQRAGTELPAIVNDMQPPAPATDVTPRRRNGLAIKARLQLGSTVSLTVSARATAAELLAVGALVSSILLSVGPIVWAARRRR